MKLELQQEVDIRDIEMMGKDFNDVQKNDFAKLFANEIAKTISINELRHAERNKKSFGAEVFYLTQEQVDEITNKLRLLRGVRSDDIKEIVEMFYK